MESALTQQRLEGTHGAEYSLPRTVTLCSRRPFLRRSRRCVDGGRHCYRSVRDVYGQSVLTTAADFAEPTGGATPPEPHRLTGRTTPLVSGSARRGAWRWPWASGRSPPPVRSGALLYPRRGSPVRRRARPRPRSIDARSSPHRGANVSGRRSDHAARGPLVAARSADRRDVSRPVGRDVTDGVRSLRWTLLPLDRPPCDISPNAIVNNMLITIVRLVYPRVERIDPAPVPTSRGRSATCWNAPGGRWNPYRPSSGVERHCDETPRRDHRRPRAERRPCGSRRGRTPLQARPRTACRSPRSPNPGTRCGASTGTRSRADRPTARLWNVGTTVSGT